MKKLLGLALFFMVVSQSAFSQKLYVWCQKVQIPTPREGFMADNEINLVIFDGRTMTPKSRIKCSSESITDNLAQLIKETYPSAKVNVLPGSAYYEKPKDGVITVKIAISAYHAAFGANVKVGIGNIGGNFSWGAMPEGRWNAVTGYSVRVYDYRNGLEITNNKTIGKIASRPNTGGFRTAKNILNSTYINANQDMFFFIDECFMD